MLSDLYLDYVSPHFYYSRHFMIPQSPSCYVLLICYLSSTLHMFPRYLVFYVYLFNSYFSNITYFISYISFGVSINIFYFTGICFSVIIQQTPFIFDYNSFLPLCLLLYIAPPACYILFLVLFLVVTSIKLFKYYVVHACIYFLFYFLKPLLLIHIKIFFFHIFIDFHGSHVFASSSNKQLSVAIGCSFFNFSVLISYLIILNTVEAYQYPLLIPILLFEHV